MTHRTEQEDAVAATPTQTLRASTGQQLASAARVLLEGTPGKLRIAGAAAVVGSLLFAVLGFVSLDRRAAALGDARRDATQLVALMSIRTDLVAADAAATNAFLVGGLEPAATRALFQDKLASATTALSDAAAGSSADAVMLGSVNQQIATYAGLIESARANNRQGYPLGSAYLRQASQLLRNEILPELTDLAVINQGRVRDAYERSRGAFTPLAIGGVIAAGAFVVVQLWLSARTRRTFNRPLLVGSAIVAVLFVLALLFGVASNRKASDVRSEAYTASVALATARSSAFDAKSAESLTLIARGNGQAYEQRFVDAIADAKVKTEVIRDANADIGWASDLTNYEALHADIRAADDAGNWEEAVAAATSSGDGTANDAFARFASGTAT